MSSKTTKKCIECGTQHYYKSKKSNYKEIGETCMNCTLLLDSFYATINALNNYIPLTGKPRKITITGYKIEKIT